MTFFGKEAKEKQMKKANEKKAKNIMKLTNARKKKYSSESPKLCNSSSIDKARNAKSEKKILKKLNNLKRQNQKLKNIKETKNNC